METEQTVFEVRFNDFGMIYISGKDYTEVELKFWQKYGGNVPNFTLKSIVKLGTII